MSDETPDTPEPSRDLRQVRIEIKSIVDATVEIGGVDVSRCLTGFSLDHHVGKIPRLVLHVAPRTVRLEGRAGYDVLKSIPDVKPAKPPERLEPMAGEPSHE